MKSIKIIISAVLLFGLAAWQLPNKEIKYAPKEITIQEAEQQAIIKANVNSKGGHSGKCIELKLENLTKKPQQIFIPAGTVFIADNSDEQNILMTQDMIFTLNGGQSKMMDVSGFCCEMSDSSPDKGSTFKVSMHKNEKVIQLVNYLKTKNFDENTLQSAVWCVANDAGLGSVYCDDEKQTNELRDKISEITGKEKVWYTAQTNYSLDEQRHIVREPTLVKGMLTTTIDKPMEVKQEVYNENNELLHTSPAMKFPRKGKYDYDFYLKVSGWKTGKYYILVKGGDQELMKVDFEI